MRVISYPFRLALNGDAATVEQGSDEHHAELIALAVLTRPGERELVPEFGASDPVFDRLSIGDVTATVSLYGPLVQIEDVQTRQVSETVQEVDIAFA